MLVRVLLTVILLSAFSAQARYELWQVPFRKLPAMREQVLSLQKIIPATTSKFLFWPNYEPVARVTPLVETLAGETSMYSATTEFARKHGGPLTAELIDKIPDWYYATAKQLDLYPNIDIRVHRLALDAIPTGYDLYPAIPGWHADGEFRETYFSQPDLSQIPVSFHVIATISTNAGGVSNTQFLDTALAMNVDQRASTSDVALWSTVHRYVESLPSYKTTDMADGEIHIFDARSLHRSTPVKTSGERMFFRMSMWHKPNLGNGQISKQEQLYLLPTKPAHQRQTVYSHTSSQQQVIGTFAGQASISHLAEEQSVLGASLDDIARDGGRISKELVALVRDKLDVFSVGKQKPVVDLLVFRLYPGYRPFFPDYSGKPDAVDWHTSATRDHIDEPEIWLTVSSHEDGVNVTDFAGGLQLNDGMIVVTTASVPRRQLPTINRGWQLMMRVRGVDEGIPTVPQKITQQYVAPSSEDIGW